MKQLKNSIYLTINFTSALRKIRERNNQRERERDTKYYSSSKAQGHINHTHHTHIIAFLLLLLLADIISRFQERFSIVVALPIFIKSFNKG